VSSVSMMKTCLLKIEATSIPNIMRVYRPRGFRQTGQLYA
jgi:hypothetical protein